MPKKRKIDSKALLSMVEQGVSQKEIMGKFGFKSSIQLKVAYANALMESGKAPEIKKTGGKGKADGTSKNIFINKRGSLTIPKDLIDELGFRMGDTFRVKMTKVGISLKKVEA